MASNLQGPYTKAFSITPNDSILLANTTNAFHAGSSGNVNVTFVLGGTAVFPVVAGYTYEYRVIKVSQTGTTALVIGLL